MSDTRSAKADALYDRATAILDGRVNGHALPILRMLAARRFAPAISVLTDHLTERQAIAALRGAARRGDALSASNLAVTLCNRGDMTGYRRALAHAARLEPDGAAADELRRFSIRFPQTAVRRLHRLRPDRA